MAEIHQAMYGESHGAHALLTATDLTLPVVRDILGATDRPGAASGAWSPFVSGFSAKTHYVLMRTFPTSPRGSRGGFVFTHALFLNAQDVAVLSDLRPIFSLLVRHVPEEPALSGPLQIPLAATESPAFRVELRARAAARKLLAPNPSDRPVVWLGDEGFEDLIARLWAGLWPEARLALRFRASFDPSDAERRNLTLVSAPLEVRERWASFSVVEEEAAVEDPTPAEAFLAGEPSPLSTYIQELRLRTTDFRDLGKIETAAQLVGKLPALTEGDLTRLVRVLAALSPDPGIAEETKERALERLVEVIINTTAAFVYTLRNISPAPFRDELAGLRSALSDWIMTHFIHEATAVGLWDQAGAQDWWRHAVDEGLQRAIRQWETGAPQAVWSLWSANSAMIEPLAVMIATHSPAVLRELAEACPGSLNKKVADRVAHAAKTHSWPDTYLMALSAGYTPGHAVEQLLETSWKNLDEALELLASRYGGEVLIRPAVEMDNPNLIEAAARQIVRRPPLLAGLDPTKRGWRRLWLSAIQSGTDPWAGIPEPQAIRDRLLDRMLEARDVEPALLDSLGRSELADLSNYPRRPELWAVLPGFARERFLAATAQTWIARFRTDPDAEPIPEAEVYGTARHNPSLLSVEAARPAVGLRAGIAAFERLPGLTEWDLLNWLRMAGTLLGWISEREAVRLGRLIEINRWKEVARWLVDQRWIPAVRPAIRECWDLLGPLVRFFAKGDVFGPGVSSSRDWHEALVEIAVRQYPRGPEDERIWQRAGGEESRIRGASGHERWFSAIDLLRSGRGGSKINPKKLVREMLEDYPHSNDLRILHDQAP